MSPELVGVALTSATAAVTGAAWLWRTSSSVTAVVIEVGIAKADIVTLKSDTRSLHDQSIRIDMAVAAMSQKLDKLDKVDQLVSLVESMRSTVDRLDRLVVPRQEIEQLGSNLMERMRMIEERALRP